MLRAVVTEELAVDDLLPMPRGMGAQSLATWCDSIAFWLPVLSTQSQPIPSQCSACACIDRPNVTVHRDAGGHASWTEMVMIRLVPGEYDAIAPISSTSPASFVSTARSLAQDEHVDFDRSWRPTPNP